MSRYVMKQDWFSFGDDYTIRDAAGEDVLRVDGKVFCIGDQLSLQTLDGRELASIDQKLMSWGPTYEIYRGDNLAGIVKKHLFTLLHCKFSVDVPGPEDLEATGSFLDMEYTFTRRGSPVAHVSNKRFFSLTDAYGIDIVPDEDDVLILASAVVIDMICHPDGKHDH